MIKKLFFAVVILSCIWITTLSAQETKVVRDLVLWSGVTVEKTLWKDWTFSLRQDVHLKKDITALNNIFTQIGIGYQINRNFSLEGNYRIIRDKNSDGSFETKSRYNADLRYKGRLDFISVYYRLRYQKEVEGTKLLDPQVPYEKYLRNRIAVRYTDLKKFEPYLSAESFQRFEIDKYARYDYFRLLAGVRYKTDNHGEFHFAYGLNREIGTTLPRAIYILRIHYTYSF